MWRLRLRFSARIVDGVPGQLSDAFALLLDHEATVCAVVTNDNASSVARRTVWVRFGVLFHRGVPDKIMSLGEPVDELDPQG